MRGDGSIYKKDGIYWMGFMHDGERIQLSCETGSYAEAKRRLDQTRCYCRGDWVPPERSRVQISDLFTEREQHYKLNGMHRMAADVRSRWTMHLEPTFGALPVSKLTPALIQQYQTKRKEEGAANATINREVQTIRTTLNHARKMGRKIEILYFPMLDEDNARKVFVDSATETKLKQAAASYSLEARVIVEMGFLYGWRKGEILNLTVGDVSLADREIRLRTSKNGDPRVVSLTGGLFTLLAALVTGRVDADRLFKTDDFRHEWRAICKAAGVTPGKAGITFHDLRRTAARENIKHAPQHVVMAVQGWKSDAMFRRYAIVSQDEQRKMFEGRAQT